MTLHEFDAMLKSLRDTLDEIEAKQYEIDQRLAALETREEAA